jgi:hypothetical protein
MKMDRKVSNLFDHLAIDLASSDVVVSSESDVDETFVVAKIEIHFSTIVKNVHFAMFKGAHRSSITKKRSS